MVVFDLRPLQTGYANRGIGRVTRELATRLAQILEEGKRGKGGKAAKDIKAGETKVYSLVFEDEENPMPEIPVLIQAPLWKRPWLWDQFILPLKLFRLRVHTFQNFVALGPLPQISFPIFSHHSIPFVHDWHLFDENASPIEIFYRKTLRIRMQKWGMKSLKRVVVNSDFVKSESVHQGFNLENIFVIPLGCDHLDSIEPECWNMENFVLSVGDTPNKNLPFTYQVLQQLREKFIHLNWVIVGKGERVLKELGLNANSVPEWIKLLESPSDGLMKACYQKALVLLFPSVKEGFGIPILEAMRLRCAVLTSNIEPMRSLVQNPHATLPLDDIEAWSNAVLQYLHHREYRQQNIDLGFEQVKKMTWELSAKKLSELY